MSKQTWTCRSPEGARPNDRSGAGLTEILITIAILAILAAFLLPSLRRTPEPGHRSQCKNNLKQIGLALHNYHDEHGSFPPAYTTNANGIPLHSWRTLILPHLDQKPLYETIALSKPWNDPANAKAYATHLPAFTCPSTDLPDGHTTYLALVGPECAFQPARPQSFRDFKDGTSKTVLVVDASPAIAVHWMNPGDSANEFFLKPRKETFLTHTGGCHALFGDGTVKFLAQAHPNETRKALSTIAGGEDPGNF